MLEATANEALTFDLGPDTPFSYRCNACSRCCHHKIIQISPYEIVRLARGLGLTTTEFIARYTTEGGTVLRRRPEDDAACVFLSAQGCSVHPDRPLVCRIYPLGAAISPDGTLAYLQLEPEPGTEGEYGADGTIAGYVAQQGVPQMRVAIAPYKRLYHRVAEILAALDASSLEHAGNASLALAEM
ncbi:MAG: YkgJ family cysteine cluster protein, partial [Rhodospirillaceae bacterium]